MAPVRGADLWRGAGLWRGVAWRHVVRSRTSASCWRRWARRLARSSTPTADGGTTRTGANSADRGNQKQDRRVWEIVARTVGSVGRLAVAEDPGAAEPGADAYAQDDKRAVIDRVALLLRAAHAIGRGDIAAAKAFANRALRTAALERLRRPILEAPPRLRGFLRHHEELAARHTWLDEAEPTRSLPPG